MKLRYRIAVQCLKSFFNLPWELKKFYLFFEVYFWNKVSVFNGGEQTPSWKKNNYLQGDRCMRWNCNKNQLRLRLPYSCKMNVIDRNLIEVSGFEMKVDSRVNKLLLERISNRFWHAFNFFARKLILLLVPESILINETFDVVSRLVNVGWNFLAVKSNVWLSLEQSWKILQF